MFALSTLQVNKKGWDLLSKAIQLIYVQHFQQLVGST